MGKSGTVDASRLKRLTDAAANEPGVADNHFKLGMALLSLAKPREGAESLRRGLELDPDNARAWVNLGGALLSAFDFAGCVEANRKAAEVEPELVEAHYNEGLGHLYQTKSEEMKACFERVVALAPEHGAGRYHLAVAQFALGQVSEARESLNEALRLGHSPRPEFMRAVAKENKLGGSPPVMEIGDKDRKTTP